MKLIAAATLIAAFVPAVPTHPDLRPGDPGTGDPGTGAGRSAGGAHAAPPAGAPCLPGHGPGRGSGAAAEARIRPGAHGVHEPNELTSAEVAAVERDMARLLHRPGPGRPGTGDRSSGPGTARRHAPATVPVYFHVLHDGAKGDVDKATIDRQISVLNSTYGGSGSGAETGFSFTLREVDRTSNAAWYSDPQRYETAFKPKLRKGDATTLNLYSADLGKDLLGWSTFPWKYRSQPKLDGVIVHEGSLPGGSAEHFNLGYSGTHEVGHWLGLYHTFQDGCSAQGDRVADTPPERDPTSGCPEGKDTCTGGGTDPIHNYMDYGWDSCMTEFTAGQATRMNEAWTAYRT
ncbi:MULTISPECIES: zinc metalloprotease [Thermomonosporaceae]|uniref:zinc metalloprotease n=1 Tax=Thermomonosporaceae TaxID=2012 RepID=UPI00255AFE69|nr:MULTISPECIES: zinc metalloprotease [Thermomonosporaceae]MDL4776209.1 zinc metalloprotease [Actinomadura xylanilytica]